MKRLLIAGAGGCGRMVLAWLRDIPEESRQWSVEGFLDDASDALDGHESDLRVIGSIRDYYPRDDDCFVVALGSPRARLEVAELLLARGGEMINVVHPSAIVAKGIRLGQGVVIGPCAVICGDAAIGDYVMLNPHATVGHDAGIGPGCMLSSYVDITGSVKLGRGVFVGSHATVLPGQEVGDFATIGAGSVVIRRVNDNTTVFGVPAREI